MLLDATRSRLAMAGDMSEFSFTAAVRGFHVYRRVWLPHVGQRLSAEREHGNVEDRFAIAVREQGTLRTNKVVGHLPREFSKVLWYFLLHGGVVECEVTERRRRSPLEQGGLEIPCCVTLRGKNKLVAKAQELLSSKIVT